VQVLVLQALGYLDSERVVQLKGRVACEVNSGDELVAAEMILDNQLDDLQPPEAVALLSAFVFQDKTTSEPELTHTLAQARDRWRLLLCFNFR
jgi:antiviral helicase SKI2